MHKKIAYGGMASALSLVLLLMSVYLPSGKAATLFLASLTVYIVVILSDVKTAAVSYGAASLLSVFITSVSAPVIVLSFAICFGNYPLIADRIRQCKFIIGIAVKLLLYTVYFTGVYFLCTALFNILFPYNVFILYGAGLPVFLFYDWLLFKCGEYVVLRFFKSFK